MFRSFGLYGHIEANRRRSWVLLAGLVALVFVATFGVALIVRGYAGLPKGLGAPSFDRALPLYLWAAWRDALVLAPLSAGIAVLWAYAGYRFHQALIDGVTGTTEPMPGEEARVRRLLMPLCISRGLAVPRIKVSADPALNAFATGMNPEQYAVTVTRGLLEALDDAELEAVLAHELTHIRNDDVRLMVIAVVIAGGLSFLGELAFRGVQLRDAGRESRRGPAGVVAILLGVAVLCVAWGLSLVLRFALSRSREYLADAGAVELTKNPDAMISALLKIAGRGELAGAPSGVMELCIDNPRQGFADLFATHPAISDRIEALMRAGGRLPPPAAEAPAFLASPWGRPGG